MARDCEHGRLARSCEICEYEAEIEELRRLLANATDPENRGDWDEARELGWAYVRDQPSRRVGDSLDVKPDGQGGASHPDPEPSTVEHVPGCNDRCDGDTHYLQGTGGRSTFRPTS